MDILKSYAHQVVSYHPEKGRDELFAELYDELCEEFSDWQVDHPGSDEAAFLDAEKEHPMRFATRLAPEGSAYLIGPQFYYSFISAIKVATVVTLGIYLAIGAINTLGSGNFIGSIFRLLVGAGATLLWVYACIIGVFIALQKSGEKADWLDNWTASKLLSIDSHQPISKSETYFDLGFALLGLLWVLGIIQFPYAVRLDGSWITEWTFSLPDATWVVIGTMLVLDIGFCIVRLARTYWTPRLRITTVAMNIAWIALLAYMANHFQLTAVNDIEVAGIEDLPELINKLARGLMYFIIVLLAFDTANHCWKLLRRGQKIRVSSELSA